MLFPYLHSILSLYLSGAPPLIDLTAAMTALVVAGIAAKAVLFIYCRMAIAVEKSDQLEALAEDHLNDVFGNVGAIISAIIAVRIHYLWWLDPGPFL